MSLTILIIVTVVVVVVVVLSKNHNSLLLSTSKHRDSDGFPVRYIITKKAHPTQMVGTHKKENIIKFTPAEMNGFQQSPLTGNEDWFPELTNKDYNGYYWDNMNKIRRHMMNTGKPVISYHREPESFRFYVNKPFTPAYVQNHIGDSMDKRVPITIIGWDTIQLEPDDSNTPYHEPQVVWILAEKDIYGKNIMYLRGANLNGIEEEVYGTD